MAEETTTGEDTTTTGETTVDTTKATTAETPGTVLAGTETKTTTTETTAPAGDWASVRTKIAGEDAKLLKQLSRYGTMEEAIKAGLSAQEKIAKTRATRPGKDAAPEELAAYREANGIPESPEGYEIALPNGIVLGDADKPYVDEFLKIAHAHHLPPEAANAIAATQLELREKEIAARAQADAESLTKASETLSKPEEWGSELKLNMNLIRGLLETAPAGVRENLEASRAADGTPLGNHVPTLKWLSSLARDINPLATVVPGSGSNSQQALESEIDKFETMMRDKPDEYWKSEKNQARYRDLLDVKLKLNK
jgi:hypothetical protein